MVEKNALAPTFDTEVKDMCQGLFSLLVDESNDQGDDNNSAILVKCVDDTREEKSQSSWICLCNLSSAVNLFGAIDKCFEVGGLDWENLIAYCSDNASVMVGLHNSVLSEIRERQTAVFDLGLQRGQSPFRSSAMWRQVPETCPDKMAQLGEIHWSSAWSALTSYFTSHEDIEKPGRVKACSNYLKNDEMKLYFLFIEFILPPLNEFNTIPG
ncbi:uncharacterized protein [Haliotis cracherodii]|uniref:uncharacterized protein n=1 Tax=Haliotis cracherodii TaxID=6455 RepID=UPI0039EBE763